MLQGVGSRFDFHINKTLCDLRYVFRHASERVGISDTQTPHVLEELALPIRGERPEDGVISDGGAFLR